MNSLFYISTLILLFQLNYTFCTFGQTYECTHKVFCQGILQPLQQQIRKFNISQDCKWIVDCPLKFEPDTVIQNFQNLTQPYTNASIRQFISQNFYSHQQDLQKVNASDFPAQLPFSQNISNSELRNFSQDVHNLWNILVRTFNHSFSCNECFTSLETNYSFVVAGDRFGEYYYWDSYWIIKGLISSGMLQTAKDMTYNFKDMINKYGFILNGARLYYTSRSQPPLFTQMVYDVYEALLLNSTSSANSYLQQVYGAMISEYNNFWMIQRTVNQSNYTMNHYSSSQFSPRPESYLEDYNRVQSLNLTGNASKLMYQNLGAGAETGWDYSSRWFTNIYDEDNIDVLDLMEADLNLILYKNEKTIAEFARIINDQNNNTFFTKQAAIRQQAVYKLLQNKNTSIWQDFNLTSQSNTQRYYAVNFMGLWAMGSELSEYAIERILQVVDEVSDFPGGVPTSGYKTGQQWGTIFQLNNLKDFPNSWPPEMGFLILGLLNTNNSIAITTAHNLIEKYVINCYCGFQKSKAQYGSGYMFEKYDVLDIGSTGEGGEYAPQKGFGWFSFFEYFINLLRTNGLFLYLMKIYGYQLNVTSAQCNANNFAYKYEHNQNF